jgi:hypothetical protein
MKQRGPIAARNSAIPAVTVQREFLVAPGRAPAPLEEIMVDAQTSPRRLMTVLTVVLAATLASGAAHASTIRETSAGAERATTAARSMWINLVNFSFGGYGLQRQGMGLGGGIWSYGGASVPPEYVAAGTSVAFGSESDGFMTGTDGWVTYATTRADGATKGQFTLRWSNPFFGRNSVGCDVPAGIFCGVSDTSGNNATVTVTVWSLP